MANLTALSHPELYPEAATATRSRPVTTMEDALFPDNTVPLAAQAGQWPDRGRAGIRPSPSWVTRACGSWWTKPRDHYWGAPRPPGAWRGRIAVPGLGRCRPR